MEDLEQVKPFTIGPSQRLLIMANCFRQREKMLGTGQEAGVVQKMGFVVENELTCVGRWWKSVQSNLFFDLGPRNAWFVAMGDFGPFNYPGILHVLNCLAHLAQESFGLDQLFVQLTPCRPRFI